MLNNSEITRLRKKKKKMLKTKPITVTVTDTQCYSCFYRYCQLLNCVSIKTK